MTTRLVIDIYQGWQGIEFKPIGIAEVYEVEGDAWPKRRQKPVIKLGCEGDEKAAVEQVRLWIEAGKPVPDAPKELVKNKETVRE